MENLSGSYNLPVNWLIVPMDHSWKLKATLEKLKESETVDASVTIPRPNLITPEKIVFIFLFNKFYTTCMF